MAARGIRLRLKMQSLLSLLAALSFWSFAAFLFYFAYLHNAGLLLAAGCILVLAGLGILLLSVKVEPAMVTRAMRERYPALWADLERPPNALRLENAATYRKFKLIADDLGVIVVHRDTQCVQIEGISYRYLVHAMDVKALKRFRENPEGFNLTYRMVGVELELTLIPYWPGVFSAMGHALLPPNSVS